MKIHREIFDSYVEFGPLKGGLALTSMEANALKIWTDAVKGSEPFVGKNKRTSKLRRRLNAGKSTAIEISADGGSTRGTFLHLDAKYRTRDAEFEAVSLWHAHLTDDSSNPSTQQNRIDVDSEKADLDYETTNLIVHYLRRGDGVAILALSEHEHWAELQQFLENHIGWSIDLCQACNLPFLDTGPACQCTACKLASVGISSSAKVGATTDAEIIRAHKQSQPPLPGLNSIPLKS